MDIKQIEYFVSIVETGSFSLAAEELYISQSSLSKQIIALEKELGLKLFDRSKRNIALTEAGRILHKHALNLKKNYQSLLADLGEYKKTTPSLTIAAIPVIAQYGITSYVAQFKKVYPQIDFTVEERQVSTVLPALSQHKYDLAFVRDYNIDPDMFSSFPLINTFANYEVGTGLKTEWTMPKRAICSKISANKMPSGFCGSNFIVSETYRHPR